MTVEIVPLDPAIKFNTPLIVGPVVDIEVPNLIVGTEVSQLEVEVQAPNVSFEVDVPSTTILVMPQAGPAGSSTVELFDSATPPTTPPATYLRFERDIDGDVQQIFLGTVN